MGEARAATLLGRSAQRFGQGALAGGAQSVAFQPLTTQAAAMEGENYTNLQALTNITLGVLAGGSIVSLSGAVGEGIGRIRAYSAGLKNNNPNGIETPRSLTDDLNTNDVTAPLLDNAHFNYDN